MADLTGSTIASSYDQLLAMPSGGGNGSTLVALTDGNAGNTFALKLSTAGIQSTGYLRLEDDSGGDYVGIASPSAVTTSYTITMPAAVGSTGQVLETSDGAGTLAWVTRDVGDITGLTAGTNISITAPTGPVPTINVDNPVVADLTGDVTGNADTATTASNVVVADESADTSCYPLFATTSSGTLPVKSGSNLTFNSSSGILTATGFAGDVTGNVSGTAATVTGATQASITTCANLTTVGTIGTGVWQGTAVDGTYIDLEGTELKSTGETGGSKFLREDGDGTSSWQAATATVTIDSTSIGSSTAGSVLFVNSSNQLSQDTGLAWTGSGSGGVLTVNNGASGGDILKLSNTANATTYLSVGIDTAGTATTTIFGSDATSASSGFVGTLTDDDFVFRTNNTERMRLTSTGLGIGGTATQPLHVQSAENAVALIESTDAYVELGLKDNTTSAGGVQIGAVGDAFYVIAGSAERMRITAAGLVGIGRTPTTNILECEGIVSATTAGVFGGTARAASYAQVECYRSGNPYVMGYDTRSSATGTGGYIRWNVKGGDGGYDSVGAVGAVCTATHATLPGGDLVFHTAEAGSAAAEKMRITSAGQAYGGVTTTTTVSSGGAASYAVDFNGANLQKLILDASLTDLTFTSSNLAAGRTVTLLLDLATNSPSLNSVSAPSWAYFVNDLNSYVPSYGYALIKLTSWGTADAAVTAEVLDSTS